MEDLDSLNVIVRDEKVSNEMINIIKVFISYVNLYMLAPSLMLTKTHVMATPGPTTTPPLIWTSTN